LQKRPRCRHHFRPGDGIEKNKRQQKGAEVTGPDNLQGIHVPQQIFSGGIETGESRNRPAHQCDAGQALMSLL
jgi:hypothetical protein